MNTNKHGIPILDKGPVFSPIGRDLRHAIYKKTKGRCFYCGKKLQTVNSRNKETYMTVDHVTPKSLKGTNNIHNLIPACRECNQQKADEEFNFYIERIQSMPENNFKHKRLLVIGETLKIHGVPVKYLGDGIIGSNTEIEWVYEDDESGAGNAK